MRYLWKFYDHEPETVEKLSRQLGVSLLTAKCLFNRGYRTSKEAEEFLNPFLRNLSDPFLIPDIEIAVERLIRAKDKGEAITIFGDYDVDGITANHCHRYLKRFFLHTRMELSRQLPALTNGRRIRPL